MMFLDMYEMRSNAFRVQREIKILQSLPIPTCVQPVRYISFNEIMATFLVKCAEELFNRTNDHVCRSFRTSYEGGRIVSAKGVDCAWLGWQQSQDHFQGNPLSK
jgi:hypothetical protein